MEKGLKMMPKYVVLQEGWDERSPILGRERRGCGQNEIILRFEILCKQDIVEAIEESLKRKRYFDLIISLFKQAQGVPKRYILTAMCSLGLVLVYAMRVNLNVALVAMVQKSRQLPHGSQEESTCAQAVFHVGSKNSTDQTQFDGEFDWDMSMQGIVLGSFFYGYVVTQIPGGIIAQHYGGRWLFGGGVLLTALFTLFSPIAAKLSVWALVAVRILMGLAEGVTYPALNSLIGKWIPEMERSKLASIIYNGSPIGTVISMSLSGLLSSSSFMGGWPSAFYVFGIFGIIWFFFWYSLIYESPDSHPTIRKVELLKIKRDQKERPGDLVTPWKSILSSRYVWALAATHFAQNWGFYTLLTELPNYMANILHFNLKENGLLLSVPYLIQPIISISAGLLADKFRSIGHYKITTIRKIFNSFAFFVPSLCLGLVPLFGCDHLAIFILLNISLGTNGVIHSGFNVTHVDMSPVFAGTLMGFTNCIANLSGFLAPLFVSKMIEKGQTLDHWGFVFLVTSMVFFVGGIIYNLLCTAERQPWDNVTPSNVTARRDDETENERHAITEIVDRPR